MVSETEPVEWNTPSTVTGDWVTAERTVERTNDDVIVTLEVVATDDMPVSVEIAEEFPVEWSVQEVGVHPDFEPAEVVVRSNRFEFSDIVDPDAPLEVVYGAKIGAPESTVPPNPLVIQRERRLESLQSSTGEVSGAEVDGEAVSVAEGDYDAEPADRDDPFAYVEEDSTEPDQLGEIDDPAAPFTRSPSAGEVDPLSSIDTSPADGPEADSPAWQHGDGGLVEALAEELESDATSDDAIATIQAALRSAESKRAAVRVDHLQSRVEEFAAYADALGAFLDEHGSLDGVLDDQEARLDDLEGDLGSLRSELDTVRTELESAADARASTGERVEAIVERVATVEESMDDLQTVPEDLERLRRDHEEAIDELDGTLEAHQASVSEDIGRLQSDIGALEDRVQEWDATRRRLADLLADGSEHAEPSEPGVDDNPVESSTGD